MSRGIRENTTVLREVVRLYLTLKRFLSGTLGRRLQRDGDCAAGGTVGDVWGPLLEEARRMTVVVGLPIQQA